MYKNEKTSYGFRLTFEGFIGPEEMENWYTEFQSLLNTHSGSFGVISDMRKCKAFPQETQMIVQESRQFMASRGLVRSAALLEDTVTTMQTRRMSKESTIIRYINTKEDSSYEKTALDWVIKGIDPIK